MYLVPFVRPITRFDESKVTVDCAVAVGDVHFTVLVGPPLAAEDVVDARCYFVPPVVFLPPGNMTFERNHIK